MLTRAHWLAVLRASGVRMSLGADGTLRVRGRMSEGDRARLARDRAGVVRLLRQRQRRKQEQRETSAPAVPAPVRKVVGQQAEVVGGQLRWSPLYADEATRVFNPSAGGISESMVRLERAIKGVARPEAARQSGSPRQWPGRFRLRTGV